MNRDDIIRMAREAGIRPIDEFAGAWITYDEPIERFANLVAAAEREACAKVCDRMASRCNDIRAAALESAAENIRARGQA